MNFVHLWHSCLRSQFFKFKSNPSYSINSPLAWVQVRHLVLRGPKLLYSLSLFRNFRVNFIFLIFFNAAGIFLSYYPIENFPKGHQRTSGCYVQQLPTWLSCWHFPNMTTQKKPWSGKQNGNKKLVFWVLFGVFVLQLLSCYDIKQSPGYHGRNSLKWQPKVQAVILGTS